MHMKQHTRGMYLSNIRQHLHIKGRVVRAQPKFRVVVRAQSKHKFS